MRLKIYLLLAMTAMFGYAGAQPLNWMESSPPEFAPLTIKGEFSQFTEGSSAVKIIFTETGTPYYVSDTFNVSPSTEYTFTIDVLDNDPGAEVNQRVRYISSAGTGTNASSSAYSTDNAAFQTLTYTSTSPADAAKAYVIIRIYDVSANWTGSGSFILDNAVFKSASGSNLIANGGFESWKAPVIPEGSTLMDWREDSPPEYAPITIVPELTAKSHGLVAAKVTFTETGTPYLVSDTFNVTANTAYTYSVDILDNDPASEVNQRIRFIAADGTGTNATSSIYSVDNPSAYQTLTYTGTSPATAVKAYVIIRMYDVTASWAGSGTYYIDNAVYKEGTGPNLIPNASFENWLPPSNLPEILSFKFEGLTPAVTGIVDKVAHTVTLTVPYATDLSALVASFTLTDGATAKVGGNTQTSGSTANNFISPVTYTLTASDGTTTQDWVVTVNKAAASTGKDIVSFRFEGLTPPVNGVVNNTNHTVALEVPSGTSLTALVPTIVLSENATVSPASGVAQNFTSTVTYTVTAQNGATQPYTVTVTVAAAGKVTLFYEDFETINHIPSEWVIINNDGYLQAAGEERWQDSAWVVATSSRIELAGTKVAMASSFTSNMPLDGRADDWMILPSVNIGNNTTISWQAMSTTSSGNYPDDYMVLIAPSVNGIQPTIPYFESEANILLKVEPENWSAGVGRPGAGLASRSINLKNAVTPDAPNGWFSKPVWIAFVLTTDRYTNPTTGIPNSSAGGSNLAIDNIKIVNDAFTGIDLNGVDPLFVVFPNPASDYVYVRMNLDKGTEARVDITDLAGKVVLSRTEYRVAGESRMEFDLSELKTGVYFVKATANGKTSTAKLMLVK